MVKKIKMRLKKTIRLIKKVRINSLKVIMILMIILKKVIAMDMEQKAMNLRIMMMKTIVVKMMMKKMNRMIRRSLASQISSPTHYHSSCSNGRAR